MAASSRPAPTSPSSDARSKTETPSAAVHRADLQALLVGEVEERTLCLGAELDGFEQDQSDVTVSLAGGSQEQADILVGADGLRSRIRAALFGPEQGRSPRTANGRTTPPVLASGVRAMIAVTAALAGALAVFVLEVGREWWCNEQERRGLLRLLAAEIDHNAEVLRSVADRRGDRVIDWMGSPDLPSLKTDTWRDVRGRVAALMPNVLTEELNSYYSPLEILLTLLIFQDAAVDSGDRDLRRYIDEQVPDVNVALTRNPYHQCLVDMLNAQDTARSRMDGYLSLSWLEPLVLSFRGWRERQRAPRQH